MEMEQISVFFPAYNEERCLKPTVEKADKVLKKIAREYEIIIVNDGSKDKTGKVADELTAKNRKIRVIHHLQNRGYGAALKSGIYSCRYPWIVFTDADGQFDFSEITKFIEKQKKTNADLVIGYYLKRAVPFYRKLNTFLWELLIRILFGLKVRDIDCGFKLFSRRVIEKIPKLESERGAFISSEFLIKAKKAGFKIVEVGVHHYLDPAGGSTGASFKVIIKSFADLFRLWKKLNTSQ